MLLLWTFFEELFLSKLMCFRAHVLILERYAEHRITSLLKCYAKKGTALKWMSGPLAAYCKTIQRSLLPDFILLTDYLEITLAQMYLKIIILEIRKKMIAYNYYCTVSCSNFNFFNLQYALVDCFRFRCSILESFCS